jgi:signal transduction histidine kinase/CHASE3 domain sensor protein
MAKTSAAHSTVRLLLQLAAVALVVSVPWLLHQRLLSDTLIAQDWVTHTAEATTQVSQVQSAVRDADRVLLWLALNPERPGEMLASLDRARAQIEERLLELERLTEDSSDQKARVAQIRVLVDARTVEADRVLALLAAGNVAMARELLDNPASMSQLRDIGEALIVQEGVLMAERRAEAEQQRRQYTWITSAFAALQLVLLALLVGLSERQHRRRTQLESQTREARDRADLILNAVRKPIALIDCHQRIVLCNPAFQALYAQPGVDLVGAELKAIGDGAWDNAEVLQKLHDVCFLGRELWDHELVQTSAQAGRRVLLVNARRMPGSDGSDPSIILTANDVTATRSAERQIRELNEQLSERVDEISEANRELERFSYSVSHDLRAPLRHIAAYALKLERELKLEPGGKPAHFLGVIGGSAQRMGVLIDELLLHSRLGRAPIKPAPVSTSALVAELRTMLESEVDGPAIEWRIGDLPDVAGDPTALRLLWQNLLGNAVKYTSRREQPLIEVEARFDVERNEHVFTVGDNGAGFDMAYVDKLFGVFQRLHTSEEFPGTGIGLANARRIVTRHGGRIWAEGEVDGGARFSFTLPAHPAPAATNPT